MSALPLNRRLALACALSLGSGAAGAQLHDHAAMRMQDMPGMDMSATVRDTTPDNEKKTALQPTDKPKAEIADPPAGHHGTAMPMDHGRHAPAASAPSEASGAAKPAQQPSPAREETTPAPKPGPHAGHAMPADMGMDPAVRDAPAMDHTDHAPPAPASAPPLPRPTPAELAAAFPDLGGMDMSLHMDDNPTVAVLRGEQLEHVEGAGTAWDARLGMGGNFDKVWLRSEGHRSRGEQAEGDVELQWSHATGPWWDRVVSVRRDFGAGPSRHWVGLGVMGLAPYKFELEAHAYVGEHGHLAARLEGDYELLLTNRLILQPRFELNAYGKNDPQNRIGRGVSQGEAGLRLRYEFTRQFAPYVGYLWSRSFGDTADLARASGEPVLDHGWIAGLRFWF